MLNVLVLKDKRLSQCCWNRSLEWESVSCNCYTIGGLLSFWDLHNKCWWTLAVHFKSYYVVIQLMEFNVLYTPFVTVLICISPSCIKILSQTSPFPQTKASAHAVVWSLQIKNDTLAPWACLTVQHLQLAAGAPPHQPLCMQPLQGVNVFSTIASRGSRATGLRYVTQGSLRGFQDWSPQELQAVYRDCVGRVRLVRSGSPVTWTDGAFLLWPSNVTEMHRETPCQGVL